MNKNQGKDQQNTYKWDSNADMVQKSLTAHAYIGTYIVYIYDLYVKPWKASNCKKKQGK